MSHWKAFGLAIFAAVCLLGETTGPADAQCLLSTTFCATEWSGGKVIKLGGLPGSGTSFAEGINDSGRVVGTSVIGPITYATEWRRGSIINLGGPPSQAFGINAAGRVVGYSIVGGVQTATEWSGGSVTNLGGPPGFTDSEARSINDAGQVVGDSTVRGLFGLFRLPPSGAAAASSTWETCRAPRIALPSASTMPGRWWDSALSAESRSPSSGAAARLST